MIPNILQQASFVNYFSAVNPWYRGDFHTSIFIGWTFLFYNEAKPSWERFWFDAHRDRI